MSAMRVYVTGPEAEQLLDGHVPDTLVVKVARHLKPAPPIEGQATIYDHLEDPCPAPPATSE